MLTLLYEAGNYAGISEMTGNLVKFEGGTSLNKTQQYVRRYISAWQC
jgi:hypothetical protein